MTICIKGHNSGFILCSHILFQSFDIYPVPTTCQTIWMFKLNRTQSLLGGWNGTPIQLLLLFSCHVKFNSLLPMNCSTPRLPCPSLSPGVCPDSLPLSWWCHPTISSSVSPFSSCPQSFPAWGSFPMRWLFSLGGQNIGALASVSVLPVNIQAWFPLRVTGLIFLLFKELLRVFYHCLKASVLWCSAFFMVQLSHL